MTAVRFDLACCYAIAMKQPIYCMRLYHNWWMADQTVQAKLSYFLSNTVFSWVCYLRDCHTRSSDLQDLARVLHQTPFLSHLLHLLRGLGTACIDAGSRVLPKNPTVVVVGLKPLTLWSAEVVQHLNHLSHRSPCVIWFKSLHVEVYSGSF